MMTQLQIGLVLIGALIVLAVLLYNWWQERKIRREMFRRFEGPVDDVLMTELRTATLSDSEEFRIDPDAMPDGQDQITLTQEMAPELEPLPMQNENVQEDPAKNILAPSMEDSLSSNEGSMARESDQQTPDQLAIPEQLDQKIDEISIIKFRQKVGSAEILDALKMLPAFSKPVRWMGMDERGAWRLLTNDLEQVYITILAAALQLVDRTGPASGEDLRNFHSAVEALAGQFSGLADRLEHTDPLQYARDLDQLCIGVDVTVSLQLVAGSSGLFAGTKLRGLAEADGMTLDEDGRFNRRDDSGQILYSLGCLENRALTSDMLRTSMLRGIILSMDVPRVINGIEAFNQMVLFGRKLEKALSSQLMDENQKPLGEPEIEKVRYQLRSIYSSMVGYGISPGSATALRLFS